MFSAYTIKKILPRLLIAAIMIQLSWSVTILAIQINNDIAHGLEGLFYAPFGGSNGFMELGNLLSKAVPNTTAITTGVFAAAAGGVGAFAVFGAGTLPGILALAATAALGVFIALFTLILRKAVLIFLVVISPLAIVAWVLPGTEKFWKLWWESFTKLLIMYPLILVMIASGRIFAYVSAQLNTNQFIGFILVVLGFFGPLFMIPATLKLAGTAFATITGVVNSRNKGVFDRLRNTRANAAKDNQERNASGNKFKGGTDTNLRGKFNKGFQGAALAPKVGGLNVAKWGSRIGTEMSNQSIANREKMLQDDEYAWKGNDGLNRFASESSDEKSLRRAMVASGQYEGNEANMERDIANVERMRRKYGNSAFRQATWLQAVAGGTAFKGGAAEPWEAAAAVSGGDDAVLADLVAKGRSAAMSSGRVDQGGAGFGDTMNLAKQFRLNPDGSRQLNEDGTEFNLDSANNQLSDFVLKSQGPGTLAHASMKPAALKNLTPAIRRNLESAVAAGDERQVSKLLASSAGVLDAMGSTSPQNAEVFADEVMSHQIGDKTVAQMVEERRNNPEFQQLRREYDTDARRSNAENLQRQAGAPLGTPPGAMPPPIGGF